MKKLLLFLGCAAIVAGSMFLQSCDNVDFFNKESEIDEVIVNSLELENFIAAGIAVEQARIAFTKELNNIDFSNLKITYDENGRRIKHLPDGAISGGIGEKIQTLNATKDALHRRFPRFSSLEQGVAVEHINRSIQRSENLTRRYVELGAITFGSPRLRNGAEFFIYTSKTALFGSLYHWVRCSSSVEKVIIGMACGRVATVIHPEAVRNETPLHFGSSHIPHNVYYNINGVWVRILWIAHTHFYSCTPTDYDIRARDNNSDIPHFIFFDNRFHRF